MDELIEFLDGLRATYRFMSATTEGYPSDIYFLCAEDIDIALNIFKESE